MSKSQVASFFSKIATFCKSQISIFQADGRASGRVCYKKKNHPGLVASRRIASIKSEFDFWTKNVSSFAQKLLTCYSSIRNVEKDATNLLFDIGHSTSTERWHHKRSILCNFNCRDQEERNGAKFQKRRANRDECFPSSTCMQ